MPDSDATLPPPPSAVPTLDIPAPGDTATLPPVETATAVGPAAVPGFDIEGELGRGGMGVVYRARQTKLNRTVALKMVLAGGHAGPQERLRFLAEAEAVAAVQHPGIVQVFEFGTSGDQPYFALEFCPGGSLAAKLAGTPLPPREAAGLVEQVARAVQAAHDKGIVHRDLKPDNVLFAADGSPKVTDFGLARKVEGDSGLTKTGAIMGTPSYMAPEQAAGKKDVGPGADVYALGAILYECLTGRPPFRAATALDTVLQVVADEPVPPRKLVPNVPRDPETIALKCLAKEPHKRYASAAALADDLRRFLGGEPIRARPVPWAEKSWKWVRRHPWLTLLLVLTAGSAGVTIGVINGTNRALRNKQALLEDETRAARDARDAAEVERAKAHTRLEKAVEAVEKLLNRVGGEKWARNPVLVEERRQILEEVVAFYEGFKDEDAKDPLVRRETARALFRIGRVYVLLAEYPKAKDVLARSRAILDGLLAESPDDGTYLSDLAETIQYTGHAITSSGGDDAEGGVAYRDAAAVARRALAARPGDEAVRRTLVSCLVSYGFYNLPENRAGGPFREALEHADALIARPDAPFPNRVLAAHTYAGAGATEFRNGQVAAGSAKMARAADILAGAKPDPAAPAEYRDQFDMTRGIVNLFQAIVVMGQDPAKAAGMLRGAADAFDRLLAVYPKAFGYRIYKLQALTHEATALAALRRTDDVRKRQAELFALEDAILRDTPKATFVKFLTRGARSEALVYSARAGEVGRLDADAANLIAYASGPLGGVIRYNIACAYAQASRHGSPAERAARAARAVKELEALAKAGYFTDPQRVKHLHADADLDPVREREDYQRFLAALPGGKK